MLIGRVNERQVAISGRTEGLEAIEDEFKIHAPSLTLHVAQRMASLDRIALSRDLRLDCAGVVAAREVLRATDHLPIWADVSLDRDDG